VPLQLTDREIGIMVCLVSTMHYNPTSILRVVGTVDMGELAPASPRQCTLCSACMYSQSNRRNRAQHRGQWGRRGWKGLDQCIVEGGGMVVLMDAEVAIGGKIRHVGNAEGESGVRKTRDGSELSPK